MAGPATFTRPSRGDELELTSTRSPTAATASRASRATSSSSPARSRATACAPSSPSPRRPTPRRARSRCSSRRPTASSRSPTTRARRGRCCPTSASSRSRPSRSTTRCARIGRLDGFELEPIVPAVEQWRYRNKLEYSFGTGADGELVCGFHAPGRWDEIVADDRLPARLRARQRGCASRCSPGAARRACRPATAATQQRLPAQPRRPRGPPHRPAPGAARHLARQARRRRADRRPSTPTGCSWTQTADLGETTYGRRDDAARRRAAARASSSAASTS